MARTGFSSCLVALASLAMLALTACAKVPPAGPNGPAGKPPAPTLEQVRAATVWGVLDRPVTLVDGAYEGPPIEAGAASRPTLTLWTPAVIFGDVDGTPGNEAVAMLSTNAGGSGEFAYLAVFALQDGKAVSIATAPVGDRVKLRRLWIDHGQIRMDVVEAGPHDPACCPTQLSRKTFALEGGRLRQKSSETVGALVFAK